MKRQDGFFTNQHGLSLYYQSWLPDQEPKAALLVIHGLNEHSGRYSHLAEYFADRGYAVYSLDQIGHGKSAGTRSYVDKFSDLIADLVQYLEMIRSWQPGVPVYAVGHSLGGLINTYLMLDYQDLVDGAVFSAAVVLVPEYVSSFTITMGKIISVLLPKLGLLEIDKDGLSRDPAVVQAYRDDPLVYNGKITVRMSSEMNEAIGRVARDGSRIKLPVLIMHGGDDRVVEPACSEYLHQLVSSAENTLIIYPGYYHEIFNEPEKLKVFGDMHHWLEARVAESR